MSNLRRSASYGKWTTSEVARPIRPGCRDLRRRWDPEGDSSPFGFF
jgi:hypothetical protein